MFRYLQRGSKRVLEGFFIIFFIFVHPSFAIQVTGAIGGVDFVSGVRPFRYEINQFASAGAAFDLFILALNEFQAVPQPEKLSYFQISGIHGYPQIPWDGVVGTGGYPGYCMHASTPFPTWHRPYVALYEQVLWQHAQMIAANYPDSSRGVYQNAALTLRAPYWDWAVNPFLPEVVTQPSISINTPDGYQAVENPLYSYRFQSHAVGNGFPAADPMANFSSTVRWWDFSSQQSNQSAATKALQSNAPSILAVTYQLFTTINDYTSFSCTWPGGKSNGANNIENIHNSIHNSVGGWGHMQFPEVAAFDPIFWLHHANVDRLFAMWQALNPNTYIVPTVNAYGSYYEMAGTIDSGNTSLAPFHSNNATRMLTSNDVRGTLQFGYTYPELIDWNISSSDLATSVRRAINSLYNPAAGTRSVRRKSLPTQPHVKTNEAFRHITFDMSKANNVNNLNRQWTVKILIDRYAYDTNFAIDFFMNEPPSNVADWATAPNLIGTHAQFIPANASLLHAGSLSGGMLHGEISITHTLAAGVARGVVKDLSPQSAIPLLRRSLNWRARTADGCEIEIGCLSGLSISVGSRAVVPATCQEEFPRYGKLEWHESITHGKLGGAKQWFRLGQ